MAYTYKDSGVDIDAGNEAVRLMRHAVGTTFRPEVMTDIGGFGGLFALDIKKYKEPVLVSGTDGVGTKLKVAFLMDKHDTIGQDAVAMCVNDVIVQGAEPLFFLDYLAVGKLKPEKVADIVSGVAAGCRLAGCALIGGETAEMPGFYPEGEYDLAGFTVGVVDRGKIVSGAGTEPGDVIIGLPSSGLHSNGFSLARKVFLEKANWSVETLVPEFGRSLGEELLTPTRIYVRSVLDLLSRVTVRGMAHITGGGLLENVPRCLPHGLGARIDSAAWVVPPVFTLLKEIGDVPDKEMYRAFNMGIGYVFVVSESEKYEAARILSDLGEEPVVIGEIIEGEGVQL